MVLVVFFDEPTHACFQERPSDYMLYVYPIEQAISCMTNVLSWSMWIKFWAHLDAWTTWQLVTNRTWHNQCNRFLYQVPLLAPPHWVKENRFRHPIHGNLILDVIYNLWCNTSWRLVGDFITLSFSAHKLTLGWWENKLSVLCGYTLWDSMHTRSNARVLD